MCITVASLLHGNQFCPTIATKLWNIHVKLYIMHLNMYVKHLHWVHLNIKFDKQSLFPIRKSLERRNRNSDSINMINCDIQKPLFASLSLYCSPAECWMWINPSIRTDFFFFRHFYHLKIAHRTKFNWTHIDTCVCHDMSCVNGTVMQYSMRVCVCFHLALYEL